MKRIFYLLSILIFTSCSNSTNSQTSKDEISTDEVSKDGIAEMSKTRFEVLNDSHIDLDKLAHEGEIVTTKSWRDLSGENVVLFSRTEEELFVYHYVQKATAIELSRRVYDFEKDCEFDLIIEFVKESISVTDLDNNDLGEITFGYKKTCTSDVSPLTLKLLMLENGEKYIMRGNTIIDYGEGPLYGGDKDIDPSFDNAPKEFLSHANKVWDNIVK